MKVFTAPNRITIDGNKSIFLAGTIDMGNSHDWQDECVSYFKDMNINIYNPRRKEWDSSWHQSFDNPQFYQQVNWELDALKKADYIIMNLLDNSKSPISLMELGLYANSAKLHVCCSDSFYRKGNIDIVCNNYNVPVFENLETLLETLKTKI